MLHVRTDSNMLHVNDIAFTRLYKTASLRQLIPPQADSSNNKTHTQNENTTTKVQGNPWGAMGLR